jgi:formylglycine-generating enzyme required for sulfatase activity
LAIALTLAGTLACAGFGAVGCSDDDSQGNDNNNNAPGICGASWIHIPEGPFVMGIDADDPRFEPPNVPYGVSPKHTVQLSAYCIERTEVSVADYRACVQGALCARYRTRLTPIPDVTTPSSRGTSSATRSTA